MNHPDIVNTQRLDDSQFVSSFPAQACTEVGADQGDAEPDTTGDGVMLGRAIVMAVVMVFLAVVAAHIGAVLTA